jgi:hypothetical protein
MTMGLGSWMQLLTQNNHKSPTQGVCWCSLLQVLLPCWATNPTAVILELHMQPYAPPSSSSKALQPAVCFARMELPLSKLAAQQSGKPGLIRDLQLAVLQGAAARSGSSAACSVTLEAVEWEVAAYLRHLQQLATAAQAATKVAAAQAAAAASSSPSECGMVCCALSLCVGMCAQLSSCEPPFTHALLSATHCNICQSAVCLVLLPMQ